MSDWTRHNGGRGWRRLCDGRIVLEPGALPSFVELDDDGAVRTVGQPVTARTLRKEHGELIAEAVDYTHVDEALIAALITCESGRIDGTVRCDPISIRHEPGFETLEETPHRVSAGLMQTLLSTARDVAARSGITVVFGGQDELIQLGDLCVPSRSITLGSWYLMHLAHSEQTEDPVLLQAAYNAGGVYTSSKNEWGLRMYGDVRLEKFAAFHNDWLAIGGTA